MPINENMRLHNDYEIPQIAEGIEAALQRGTISLAEALGSFRMWRGNTPGFNPYLGTYASSSFLDVQKELIKQSIDGLHFEKSPRKIDREYAEYIGRTFDHIQLALMIGDTESDVTVIQNLNDLRLRKPIQCFGVIVNRKLAEKYANDAEIEESSIFRDQKTDHHYFYHWRYRIWFATDWRVIPEALDTFQRKVESTVKLDPGNVMIFTDIDKTLIGPRAIPTHDGLTCDYYIDQARIAAVSDYAQNEIFRFPNEDRHTLQVMQKWNETYQHVKKTGRARFWDDEDANTFMTGLVFFGFTNLFELELEVHESFETFALKAIDLIRSNRSKHVFSDSDSLHNFINELQHVAENIQSGNPTPFGKMRKYEAKRLREFLRNKSIAFNRSVIETILYAIEHGWGFFGLSDKPDESIGLLAKNTTDTSYPKTILSLQGPIIGPSIYDHRVL